MSHWPYEDPKDVLAAPEPLPRWDCPGGVCDCQSHPQEESNTIAILLRDDYGERMSGAHCRVWYNGRLIADDLVADGGAWVRPEVPIRARVLYLEWAPPELPIGEGYPISKPYIVNVRDDNDREAVRQRLANLGYCLRENLSDNVRDFQRDKELKPVNGNYQAIKKPLESYHDDGIEPGAAPSTQQPSTPQPPAGPAFVRASFQDAGQDDAQAPGGGSSNAGPGLAQQGSAQFSSDFPAPLDAEAQGKTFHEFQSAGTSVFDPAGKEWLMFFLISRDALKWEVPTGSVRGRGVSVAEGQYWERMFKDLTNPDPIIPAGGLNPKRVCRLPSSAKNAQHYANATGFSVAQLLNTRTLKHLKELKGIREIPANDTSRKCLLPTPLLLDLRWEMYHQATHEPRPSGNPASPVPSVLIPDTWKTNNEMNALYASHDIYVGNPGKIWAISNKLYLNPHKSKSRRLHNNGNPVGVNYGWHTASQAKAGTAGGPSTDGKAFVIQKPEAGHDILYKDYSQIVILVAGWFVLHDPYANKWTWLPTEDIYLSQGDVKKAETAHGVELSRAITAEPLPLVTSSTF